MIGKIMPIQSVSLSNRKSKSFKQGQKKKSPASFVVQLSKTVKPTTT